MNVCVFIRERDLKSRSGATKLELSREVFSCYFVGCSYCIRDWVCAGSSFISNCSWWNRTFPTSNGKPQTLVLISQRWDSPTCSKNGSF